MLRMWILLISLAARGYFSPETEEFEDTDRQLLGICMGQGGPSYEHMKVNDLPRLALETDFGDSKRA